jgi:hypothetical protein
MGLPAPSSIIDSYTVSRNPPSAMHLVDVLTHAAGGPLQFGQHFRIWNSFLGDLSHELKGIKQIILSDATLLYRYLWHDLSTRGHSPVI